MIFLVKYIELTICFPMNKILVPQNQFNAFNLFVK